MFNVAKEFAVRASPFLFAILAVLAFGASAQVTVDPASPKPFFEVRVKVNGTDFGLDLDGNRDFYQAKSTTVTMVGNKITISPLMTGGSDFSAQTPQPAMDQTIGALPPGTYQVEVIKRATGRGSVGQVGSTVTFTVGARPMSDPIANHTDLWWVPSESGWGLGLFHHPSHQIFGTIFVYGADSKPVWYVLPAGTFTEPTRFTGVLFKTTGPYFGGAFNPAAVGVTPAGTAVITFDETNLSKAVLRFTVDGVEVVKNIERQSF